MLHLGDPAFANTTPPLGTQCTSGTATCTLSQIPNRKADRHPLPQAARRWARQTKMAFVSPTFGALRTRRRAQTCLVRMSATPPEDSEALPPPTPNVSNNAAVPGKRLVRNLPVTNAPEYAEAAPGDMGKSPVVGEGMGPRRGTAEKKVTKAAAIQKSQTFADAWAEQNQGRPDVWLFIGAAFLLTPFIILIWGVVSGAIPTGGLFDG